MIGGTQPDAKFNLSLAMINGKRAARDFHLGLGWHYLVESQEEAAAVTQAAGVYNPDTHDIVWIKSNIPRKSYQPMATTVLPGLIGAALAASPIS